MVGIGFGSWYSLKMEVDVGMGFSLLFGSDDMDIWCNVVVGF